MSSNPNWTKTGFYYLVIGHACDEESEWQFTYSDKELFGCITLKIFWLVYSCCIKGIAIWPALVKAASMSASLDFIFL